MPVKPRTTSPRFPLTSTRSAGSSVWVLIRPLEFFVQTFNCIRCANRFPMAIREAREGEQLVARFLQSVSDRATFQPPFADECLALCLHRRRVGVDHIVAI